MKILLVSLFLIISTASKAAISETLTSVSELQWKNRIVLVNGSESDLALLTENQNGIIDRDIIWFLLINNTIYSNSIIVLSETFQLELKEKYFTPGIATVLIGKDSGIKSKQSTLNLKNIFALIDSMPMRIQEMKQKQSPQ